MDGLKGFEGWLPLRCVFFTVDDVMSCLVWGDVQAVRGGFEPDTGP